MKRRIKEFFLFCLLQVLLAAKEAVGSLFVVLPYAANGFLNGQRVGHLAYLLEFVYTHHHVNASLLIKKMFTNWCNTKW